MKSDDRFVLQYSVSKTEADMLYRIAEVQGISTSEVIRNALSKAYGM